MKTTTTATNNNRSTTSNSTTDNDDHNNCDDDGGDYDGDGSCCYVALIDDVLFTSIDGASKNDINKNNSSSKSQQTNHQETKKHLTITSLKTFISMVLHIVVYIAFVLVLANAISRLIDPHEGTTDTDADTAAPRLIPRLAATTSGGTNSNGRGEADNDNNDYNMMKLGGRSGAAGSSGSKRFRPIIDDVLNSRRKNENNNNNKHHRKKKKKDDELLADVQELYLSQNLDHFHPTDKRTYQQRYFYSDRYIVNGTTASSSDSNNYHNDNNKPILALLCIGGEGPPLEKSVLVNSVHCSGDMLEFAKTLHQEYRVHLYALEHRYYGSSYPKFVNKWGFEESPVTNENLIYLNSQQAIADISHFITSMNFKMMISHPNGTSVAASSSSTTTTTKTPYWIAFGGSYPGMLASWSRLKYPHLVHSAVGNSAPIQPILDFASFNNHLSNVFADPKVGGSPKCLHIIQHGHEELIESIITATLINNITRLQEIANDFGICDYKSLTADASNRKRNIQMFVGDGVLINANIQGNDPSCNTTENKVCNVQHMCEGLENRVGTQHNNSNMQALSWYLQQKLNMTVPDPNDDDDDDDTPCIDLDWDETINEISNPYSGQEGGLRSWLWQTCTEFGFFQTCELNSTCPYGRGYHPLDLDLEICSRAFDVAPLDVARNIQSTLETYGGWNIRSSRILSVIGTIDPWSELAMQKSRENTKDMPVYHVPAASHHFWTHPVKDSDDESINRAREIIIQTLRSWLDDDEEKEEVLLPVVNNNSNTTAGKDDVSVAQLPTESKWLRGGHVDGASSSVKKTS